MVYEDDRMLVAHMTAVLIAQGGKSIKQAVHESAQILECVDARVHAAALKRMLADQKEEEALAAEDASSEE